MKLRQVLFLGLALVSAFLLAFPLRGVIQDQVILPLAKFFWIAEGYYGALPQAVYWILALVGAALLAVFSLRLPDWEGWRRRQKNPAVLGPVEELSFWLQRRRNGNYPRWYVARLLADLAVSLLGREVQEKHTRELAGQGWEPPAEVRKYLDTALNTNYTEYQRRKRMSVQPSTAFDQDLDPIIDYLESFLESENDYHS